MSNFASLIAAFICAKCQVDLQWPFTLHNWIVISFCWFARRYTFINFGDTPEFVGPKLGPHIGWTVRFLTPDLSKSRSIEKLIYSCPTVRKFYWLLVETPDKSQGDRVIKKKQSRDFEIPRDLAVRVMIGVLSPRCTLSMASAVWRTRQTWWTAWQCWGSSLR